MKHRERLEVDSALSVAVTFYVVISRTFSPVSDSPATISWRTNVEKEAVGRWEGREGN